MFFKTRTSVGRTCRNETAIHKLHTSVLGHYCTISVTSLVWVTPPPLALIVIWYVPAGVPVELDPPPLPVPPLPDPDPLPLPVLPDPEPLPPEPEPLPPEPVVPVPEAVPPDVPEPPVFEVPLPPAVPLAPLPLGELDELPLAVAPPHPICSATTKIKTSNPSHSILFRRSPGATTIPNGSKIAKNSNRFGCSAADVRAVV